MLMVVMSSEASMSPHPVPPISSAKAITKGMVPKNEVVNGSSNEKLFVIASEDEQANAQVHAEKLAKMKSRRGAGLGSDDGGLGGGQHG
ncbi:hypothetical protein HN51_034989 [Arachis hypogaea]